MSEQIHKQNVSRGRLVDELKFQKGWTDVLLPKLKAEIAQAHERVFDLRVTKDDTATRRIAYYNGLHRVLELVEMIDRDRKRGQEYFDELGINI